jgi:membrane-associated phospholipid phosphatase
MKIGVRGLDRIAAPRHPARWPTPEVPFPAATADVTQRIALGTGTWRDCWLERCPASPPPGTGAPPGRSLLTLVLLGGTLAAVALAPEADPFSPRWTSKNGFDTSARSALVGSDRDMREAASLASDILLAGLGVGLAADWLWQSRAGRYSFGHSAATDTSWVLGSLLATTSFKWIAGRQRPYVEPCSQSLLYVSSCLDTGDWNASFFSGHASLSATLAGLICARRLALESRSGTDWAICGGAVATSGAVGLLRVTADRHWMTDVLVGWSMGALFGYVLPRVFDYHGPGGPFSRVSVVPMAGTRRWGMLFALDF